MLEKIQNQDYMQQNISVANNSCITKDSFKNIDFAKEFMLHNKEFNQTFELSNYVNSGSCGVVYEGKYKKHEENKIVGIKFIINKLLEKKRELIKQKNQNELYRSKDFVNPKNLILNRQKFIINNNNHNNIQNNMSANNNINIKNNYNILPKEINIQRPLKHKNITSLLDVKFIDDVPCLIMEYAKYGDLFYFQNKLIQKKFLSETMIAYFCRQIFDAIKYCHNSKLIHIDIKPQNILIDENLNIKLSDFSVSFTYKDYKPEDKIRLPLAGTSLFMSPEILGKEEILAKECEKIDIYSIGVLLYNLAFGEYPYDLNFNDKKEFPAIKKKIENNRLDIPNLGNYSLLFRKFLTKLLDKNLKQRYSINDVYKDTWFKGIDLIYEAKEKIVDLEKFIVTICTDNIESFNAYLKKYKTSNLLESTASNYSID